MLCLSRFCYCTRSNKTSTVVEVVSLSFWIVIDLLTTVKD
jgi:hypothetical protein